MKLPDLADRIVPDDKVRLYLLNREHPDGGSKAAFFISFGFVPERPEELKRALLQHPVDHDIAFVRQKPDGERYEVLCTLATPDGRDPCIKTVWGRVAGRAPWLITAHPA